MDEVKVIGFDYYGQIGNVPVIGCFNNSFTGLTIPGFEYDVDLTVFGKPNGKSGVEVFFITKHIDGEQIGGEIANYFSIPFERQVGKVHYDLNSQYGLQSPACVRIGGASMEQMEILFCQGDKLLFAVNCYDPEVM